MNDYFCDLRKYRGVKGQTPWRCLILFKDLGGVDEDFYIGVKVTVGG